MRIQDRDAIPAKEESMRIVRNAGHAIEIVARALMSYDRFHELNPAKSPGWVRKAGGVKEENTNSQAYKDSVELREKQFEAWLVVESITDASNIEWATVDREKPETWMDWEKEFTAFGISAGERRKIKAMVDRVNSFADDTVGKAMNDFLAGLQNELAALKSSQQAEKESTNSTEPASDSASFPQE